MRIISIDGDYYHGVVDTPNRQYRMQAASIGNGMADIHVISPDQTTTYIGRCSTDCSRFLNAVEEVVLQQYPQAAITPTKVGYIIKTNEYSDARYKLEIDYENNIATLTPLFLSEVQDSCPYNNRCVCDLFAQLHTQLLPQLKQEYDKLKAINPHPSNAEQHQALVNKLATILGFNGVTI